MDDIFSLRWLRSHPSITSLKISHSTVELEYYVYGKKPRLFISSGMHGDEQGVIASVSKAIKSNLNKLPSFIYIPIIAPSAIKKGTRKNALGQDINRGFSPKSNTDESKIIMKIVQSYQFDLSISFHEDPVSSKFYMYDILANNEGRDISGNFRQFKRKLVELGIPLLNGIDDPKDPTLGFMFTDGYHLLREELIKKDNAQLEEWLVSHQISSRVLNPEIPGKCLPETKDALVAAFFTQVILPFS